MIKTLLYIAIGGAIGSVMRYLMTLLVNKYWTNNFPIATLITNVAGCFLIGLFIGILQKNNLNNNALKCLLITGFCGGFTTFSAFANENFILISHQNTFLSLFYIASSIFLGIFFVWLGLILMT